MRVLDLVADDFELVVATPIAATPINLIDAAAFVAELVLIAILVARGLRDAVPRASKVASAFDQVIQCRTGRGRRAHDRQGPCHVVVRGSTARASSADALGGRKRGLGSALYYRFKADCLCFEVFRTELTD